MRITPRHRCVLPLLLIASLASAAGFAHETPSGIDAGIRADLDQARREVQVEMAQARAELETGNLELGGDLRFGGDEAADEAKAPPQGEITPDGALLVDGRAVAIDAGQRRELLSYRRQVIDIALAGIELGERSANVAIDAVDQGLFRLMFGAMTGSLERRMEKTIRQTVEPGVRQICGRLPGLYETQQRLAQSVPEFRPYATLEARGIDDCMDQVTQEFARR